MNSKTTFKRIIGISAIIIAMLTVALNIKSVMGWVKGVAAVFTPILVGVCLAFILGILVNRFENNVFVFINKKKQHPKTVRTLSIVATFLVFFGAIAILLLVIIPQISRTAAAITAGLPAFTQRALVFIREILQRFNLTSERISEILLGGENFLDKVTDIIKNNVGNVINSVSVFGGSVIATVVNTFLGLFLSVYFLAQKDLILSQIKRFCKALFSEKMFNTSSRVVNLSAKAFSNFIGGQLIEAVILGLLCFAGMLILQIPYAPVVSVIIGTFALIPILGAWIGGAISALLILISDPIKALWFLIFLVVLQQLEGNFIYPRVVGRQVGLPGVWVLLSVIIGNGLLGPIGALFAVPFTSILYVLASEFTRNCEKTQEEIIE